MRLLPALALLATVTTATAQTNAQTNLPHLERRGDVTQLIVDGQPMLVLGGEVHNSSSSSVNYMKGVWPHLVAQHLNTAILPVAWETIEPTEGTFDFSNVDGLLAGARDNHMHLVLLWFGAWKNTFSSYVPAWVKTNQDRFPRVQSSTGRGTERMSPFSANVRDADALAFAALMHHLHEVDTAHTVIIVQVENEVGVLPESRDHSTVAEAAFAGPVPPTLTHYLEIHRNNLNPLLRTTWEQAGARSSGTWRQVFGDSPLTDDLFMAWHYATFIQTVTAAGKAQYPLPMYANAALIRPNYQPGQYNSGGPLPHSAEIWRAAAPALDFLSPDIYFNEFSLWAGQYSSPTNPLFIPEAQGGAPGAANALYAFGQLNAVGFSVFGIDDQGNTPLDLVGITNPADHIDTNAISSTFAELSTLSPRILQAQAAGTIHAVVLEGEAQRGARILLGKDGPYMANITRDGHTPGARISVLILATGPNEFLVAGSGEASVTFTSDRPGPPIVGIESVDEVFLHPNALDTIGRRLNGDETSQGQSLRLLAGDTAQGKIYRVRLYRYH